MDIAEWLFAHGRRCDQWVQGQHGSWAVGQRRERACLVVHCPKLLVEPALGLAVLAQRAASHQRRRPRGLRQRRWNPAKGGVGGAIAEPLVLWVAARGWEGAVAAAGLVWLGQSRSAAAAAAAAVGGAAGEPLLLPAERAPPLPPPAAAAAGLVGVSGSGIRQLLAAWARQQPAGRGDMQSPSGV